MGIVAGAEIPRRTASWGLAGLALFGLWGCGSGSGRGPGTNDPGDPSGAAGSGAGTTTTAAPGEGPHIGSCSVFPGDNPWNLDVSSLPVRADSDTFIDSIGRSDHVHPDFGTEWEGAPIGIPFVTVGKSQRKVAIEFTAYGDESDPGPYPVPADAPVEGGADGDGDRHVLVVDT